MFIVKTIMLNTLKPTTRMLSKILILKNEQKDKKTIKKTTESETLFLILFFTLKKL